MAEEYIERLKSQMREDVPTGFELALAEAVLALAGEDPAQVSPEAKRAYETAATQSVADAVSEAKHGDVVDKVDIEVPTADGDTTTLEESPVRRGVAVGDASRRPGDESPVVDRNVVDEERQQELNERNRGDEGNVGRPGDGQQHSSIGSPVHAAGTVSETETPQPGATEEAARQAYLEDAERLGVERQEGESDEDFYRRVDEARAAAQPTS